MKGEGRQDHGTPIWLFKEADRIWGPFELDAAASPDNALCEIFYTKEDDGLVLPWFRRTWLNPPYSRDRGGVEAWFDKAAWSARWARCTTVMLLDVVVVSTRWFAEKVWWPYIFQGWPEVIPIHKRLQHRGAPTSAPFPSILVVCKERSEPCTDSPSCCSPPSEVPRAGVAPSPAAPLLSMATSMATATRMSTATHPATPGTLLGSLATPG